MDVFIFQYSLSFSIAVFVSPLVISYHNFLVIFSPYS
jgi:hypothetical protein